MTLWKVLMTGLQTTEDNLLFCNMLYQKYDVIRRDSSHIIQIDRAPNKRREPLFCNMLYKKFWHNWGD